MVGICWNTSFLLGCPISGARWHVSFREGRLGDLHIGRSKCGPIQALCSEIARRADRIRMFFFHTTFPHRNVVESENQLGWC